MKIVDHFKEKHTWLDFLGMLLLWSMTFFLKLYLPSFVISIIKIFAIVSTLEFLSFTFFHFISNSKNILLQSFIGGFISSTSVFVNLTDNRNPISKNAIIVPSLLLAYIAMLIECILIFYSLNGFNNYKILLPIFVQLICLLFFYGMMAINKDTKGHIEINSDHPIIWKKVLSLSAFIIFLILSLKFISSFFASFTYVVAFLLSLFEAHGVYTAIISKSNLSSSNEIILQTLLILSGNFISKSLLVLKNKDLYNKLKLISIFTLSLVLTWISYILI